MSENTTSQQSESEDNGTVDAMAALAMVILLVASAVFWVSQL